MVITGERKAPMLYRRSTSTAATTGITLVYGAAFVAELDQLGTRVRWGYYFQNMFFIPKFVNIAFGGRRN